MTALTPIAARLAIALDDDCRRMQNEWFFRWHFIGRDGLVEIDMFDGRTAKYGGATFWGTTQQIYWETIQRYLRKKIGSTFDDLEQELLRYPVTIRERALKEVRGTIGQFITKIRRAAIEKDRILRGNGLEFPPERDQGKWEGCQPSDIEARIAGLAEIYCKFTGKKGGSRMSYKASVLKVMIASPSDVAAEREIIRNVVHEWNAVHSEDRGIVLIPIGWESHSSPAMGDRPQEIINKQILNGCDLLIAVFWTKFGTPTGKADSGTAEEINEHLAAGKPALIYFSSEPVVPDSINPEQYKALKAFEQEKMGKGLIERYDSKTEFREKLTRQLAQTIIREFDRGDDLPEGDQFPTIAGVRPQIEITDAGRELLLEAVKDKNGIVMMLQTLNGNHVQTNGRDFVQSDDSRTVARWRGAVGEIELLGFIEDRGGKGEVFFVTNAGFEAADRLAQGA